MSVLVTRLRRAAERKSAGHRLRPRRARQRLSTAKWSFAAATAVAVMPAAARAQVGTDIGRAPTLTIERYPEDWSHLADPAKRTGRWTEQFKYIPLSGDGSMYLTTGGEARSRYEGYGNVNWGSAPDDGYVWHRLMPYADFHAGRVRLFAQPILSAISGVRRAERPVDTTGADMLQGFAEVEMDVAERIFLRMSAGRKLVSLGAGRFIDTRYGPNIPQAFDGLDATLTGPTRQVTALYFRPVDNEPGDFDGRASREKAVWGVYATQWLRENRAIGFDIYYLGLRDRNVVFDQGAGREVAHTIGSRIFGDTGDWHWNLEGALQGGTFAGRRVAAWGVGSEIGHRFLRALMQPDVSLTADVISGDDDPDDRKLGTFNPMFPRGKYFGALSPVGPRNLIHIRPSVTVDPRKDVAVSLSGAAYWRESTRDGIYAISGNLVRSGTASNARFIGKQLELAVAWQATAELNLSVSVSAFDPGRFIHETGPARTATMVGAMAGSSHESVLRFRPARARRPTFESGCRQRGRAFIY
ncbi:alginate export family protein [Bradyrhizobium sp. Arg237L]|uniref:alginate export family protein n=1 Tax=Bradyrhizobium sp. Arg237L TaxID=3003352 RepID=UPI00249EF0AA|nr:alginate export family protein [Bradyrhizobium sp. Arg237L]MDI4239358.1 alginate export family protein [Bradyrhizobium sp. Arg237L]